MPAPRKVGSHLLASAALVSQRLVQHAGWGSHYAAGGTEQGSTSCVTELSLKELIRPADGETEALSSPCCFPSHHDVSLLMEASMVIK